MPPVQLSLLSCFTNNIDVVKRFLFRNIAYFLFCMSIERRAGTAKNLSVYAELPMLLIFTFHVFILIQARHAQKLIKIVTQYEQDTQAQVPTETSFINHLKQYCRLERSLCSDRIGNQNFYTLYIIYYNGLFNLLNLLPLWWRWEITAAYNVLIHCYELRTAEQNIQRFNAMFEGLSLSDSLSPAEKALYANYALLLTAKNGKVKYEGRSLDAKVVIASIRNSMATKAINAYTLDEKRVLFVLLSQLLLIEPAFDEILGHLTSQLNKLVDESDQRKILDQKLSRLLCREYSITIESHIPSEDEMPVQFYIRLPKDSLIKIEVLSELLPQFCNSECNISENGETVFTVSAVREARIKKRSELFRQAPIATIDALSPINPPPSAPRDLTHLSSERKPKRRHQLGSSTFAQSGDLSLPTSAPSIRRTVFQWRGLFNDKQLFTLPPEIVCLRDSDTYVWWDNKNINIESETERQQYRTALLERQSQKSIRFIGTYSMKGYPNRQFSIYELRIPTHDFRILGCNIADDSEPPLIRFFYASHHNTLQHDIIQLLPRAMRDCERATTELVLKEDEKFDAAQQGPRAV